LDSEEENPGHIYPAQTNGGYIVTLIASDTNGCTDQAQAYFVINETLVVNVPNSFTINNDGINDDFKPVFSNMEMLTEYYFSIYNRWGQIVFETNDPISPWDGKYKGLKVPIGSYNWQITYKDDNFIERTISGHVNLLR
jgi:gliding motility-associated-like protein